MGVKMFSRFSKKGLPLLRPSRVVKARYTLVRIFTVLLITIYCVSTVPARAIETTKASALVLKEMHKGDSLSFTKKSPSSANADSKADPCLPLLHASRLSPGASAVSQRQSLNADKKAVPVALGFFLGVRVALGPKEVMKNRGRVQIGPEIRSVNLGQDNYALAVAAYRGCKNEYDLGMRHNK